MKKSIVVLFPLFGLLLSGCNLIIRPNVFPSSYTSGDVSSDTSSTSSTSHEHGETATIEIYATNDIHGQIVEEQEDGHPGVGKLMTYLKEKKQSPNTLLLDQGDTWQGSIYSNYNHGNLITDVMNFIHYDARTIGNHDFDWGQQRITENKNRNYNGYSTPVLAGNVYNYNFDTKVTGSTQQSQLGAKSVTYTLANGVKVGILGGIGSDQIKDISTNIVYDVAFTDHISFIKDEATHLRNDEQCDVVIASIHSDEDTLRGYNLENYVDLVLCGHSHQNEYSTEGNLYYSQCYANTGSLAHITLTYDFDQCDVISTTRESISGYSLCNSVTAVDSTIQSIINTYNSECNTAANTVVANNVTGDFYKDDALANLVCRAIYEQAVSEGHSGIVLSYVNKARDNKGSGTWKYADLYDAFPFDNNVYIAEITGQELLDQCNRHNFRYALSSTPKTINPSNTYQIAVLDFLYYHSNASRYFDYFPTSAGKSNTILSKNYREILRDWLISNGYSTGKALSPDDFTTSEYYSYQFSSSY